MNTTILRLLFLILLNTFLGANLVLAQNTDTTKNAPLPTDTLKISLSDSLNQEISGDGFFVGGDVLMIDSTYQDSLLKIRLDSLRKDSLLKVMPSASVNISARKRTLVPLPEGMELDFIDSADVKAYHYLAIENYFKTTFNQKKKKSLFSVEAVGRNYKTEAFVRSQALLQAEYLERKSNLFISEQEIDAFAKQQKEHFFQFVEVVLDIKTSFIGVTELDTSLFVIRLESNESKIKPVKTVLQPLLSHITEFIPWYQRRILIVFPRHLRGTDLWDGRLNILSVHLRDPSIFYDPLYQVDFEFNLNPENRIIPEEIPYE